MKLRFVFCFYLYFLCLVYPCWSKKHYKKMALQDWNFYRSAFQTDLLLHKREGTQSFLKKKKQSQGIVQNVHREEADVTHPDQDKFIGVALKKEDFSQRRTINKKTEKKKTSRKDVLLLVKGVVAVRNQLKVFFTNKRTGKTYFLAEREEEAGMYVQKISDTKVVFIVDGEKIVLARAF